MKCQSCKDGEIYDDCDMYDSYDNYDDYEEPVDEDGYPLNPDYDFCEGCGRSHELCDCGSDYDSFNEVPV